MAYVRLCATLAGPNTHMGPAPGRTQSYFGSYTRQDSKQLRVLHPAGPRGLLGPALNRIQHPIGSCRRPDPKQCWVLHPAGPNPNGSCRGWT